MPDWTQHIRPRLASLHLSPVRENEIAEELAQHLEDRWRELVAGGATPDDAARTAGTEFDGARLEAHLATLRQAHWRETPPPGPSRGLSLDSILIDLRHAVRALRATPSFTIGALLVLALGTGATTAIFSVVDAVEIVPAPQGSASATMARAAGAAPARDASRARRPCRSPSGCPWQPRPPGPWSLT